MDQSEQDFSERKQQYYNCQKQAEVATTKPVSVLLPATTQPVSAPATVETNNDVEPPTPSSVSTASRQLDNCDTIAGHITFSDQSNITTSLFNVRYGQDKLAKYAVLLQAQTQKLLEQSSSKKNPSTNIEGNTKAAPPISANKPVSATPTLAAKLLPQR